MAWHTVAKTWDLQEGTSLEVVIHGEVIAIFRSENSLYAMEGMCAHQGGPLAKGKVSNGCVTCPWHGWQYLLQNGNNAVTCKPMLRTYPIREADDRIEVEFA